MCPDTHCSLGILLYTKCIVVYIWYGRSNPGRPIVDSMLPPSLSLVGSHQPRHTALWELRPHTHTHTQREKCQRSLARALLPSHQTSISALSGGRYVQPTYVCCHNPGFGTPGNHTKNITLVMYDQECGGRTRLPVYLPHLRLPLPSPLTPIVCEGLSQCMLAQLTV